MAQTMRAIVQNEFGGPEVLELVEMPVPEPESGQVLVKTTVSGINFADTHTRENKYVQKAQLPLIPGQEVAGIRVDTGERVVGMTRSGGCYAEYALIDERFCVPIPEGLSDEQAVALQIQGLTAWHLFKTCAKLDPESQESVVIHSAAGGTGSLATQLARPMGAGVVIATASSQEKLDLALGFGADVAVDVGGRNAVAEEVTERLITANGGRQVDVVIDMSGGAIFEGSLKALAPFGRIIVCGIAGKQQNEIRSGHLLRHSRSVLGFWLFHTLDQPERMFREPLEDLFARAARGEIEAQVGGSWPLEQAAQAQTALVGGGTSGKLLLTP